MNMNQRRRAHVDRALRRNAHAPDRQALMERGLRASYFGALLAQERPCRNKQRRQHRRDARFYGGSQWSPREMVILGGRRNGLATLKAMVFNTIQRPPLP